jgi:hypothetical protein
MSFISADRAIFGVTSLAVVAVAGFAGVVSYSHFYELGRSHGQDGVAARLTPLSVDLLILAASLVLLWAARNRVDVPRAIRGVLVAGVVATIAGNVLYGWGDGIVGAALSSWPGAAFVAAVEMLMWLVRAAKKVAADRGHDQGAAGPPSDAESAARASLAATLAAGNPWSANQLQAKFGLTRAQATKVRAEIIPAPVPELAAASMNGSGRDE